MVRGTGLVPLADFLGPVMTSNDTVGIKWKIVNEQAQLPRDNANVIVILALDAFGRGRAQSVNDAEYLFRSQKLDAQVLRDRYENEFRSCMIGDVARTDSTLKLWIDIFTS